MDFHGAIIEESLEDTKILKSLKILKTEIEKVTPEYNTPWLKKWTIHSFEVSEDRAMEVGERIANSIDSKHASSWYIDYKNSDYHFIIFKKKIFVVDKKRKEEYEDVLKYGRKLGISECRLDFLTNGK